MQKQPQTQRVREQQLREIYPELAAWDGDCILAAWSVYRGLSRKSDDLPAARDDGFIRFITGSMQARLGEEAAWN